MSAALVSAAMWVPSLARKILHTEGAAKKKKKELTKFASYYKVMVAPIHMSHRRTQGLQFPLTPPPGRMVNIKGNIRVLSLDRTGHPIRKRSSH